MGMPSAMQKMPAEMKSIWALATLRMGRQPWNCCLRRSGAGAAPPVGRAGAWARGAALEKEAHGNSAVPAAAARAHQANFWCHLSLPPRALALAALLAAEPGLSSTTASALAGILSGARRDRLAGPAGPPPFGPVAALVSPPLGARAAARLLGRLIYSTG